MKSNNRRLLALTSLGLSLTAFGIGCDDEVTSTGSGGSGSGGDASTTSTMVTVGSTGGGGGGTGDGNDTIATAEPLVSNMGTLVGQGELDPADTDVDFWSFTGAAGPTLIYTDAKPATDGFADGYVDVVVTLFDSNGTQLATNDDPFPRGTQDAQLYTLLPAAGTYYVKVQDFCTTADGMASPGCDSTYFSDLTDVAYAVAYLPLDGADVGTVAEAAEQNDTLTTAATLMEYSPCTATGCVSGDYFTSVAYGNFGTADTDAIRFTIPADSNVDVGDRLNASFVFPPPGTDGNGSSVNPGIVEIVDPVGPTVVARLDLGAEGIDTDRAELFVPLTSNKEYFLRATEGPGATGGSVPFYFLLHSAGGGYPIAAVGQETTNNLPATPEVLTALPMSPSGVTRYAVEGDLIASDLDHFRVAVGTGVMSVYCDAQRSGSGIRGLKATVLKNDGTGAAFGTDTETATTGVEIEEITVGTETNVLVKVEQGTPDANVTSNFFRCFFYFGPPAP